MSALPLAPALRALRARVETWMRRRNKAIADPAGLGQFLDTRASFVAQTALYGYLRTRAGIRYPTLYDSAAFGQSVNIAKWHVWLGCLSDLAVFSGGLIARRVAAPEREVGALMLSVLDAILGALGTPSDAGGEFTAHAGRVRARLTLCNWGAIPDDASAFIESSPALVHWSPVADELKRHDQEIVRSSIRFLWQDVRRDLRRRLDAAALLAAARAGAITSPA